MGLGDGGSWMKARSMESLGHKRTAVLEAVLVSS
jgi:hypothetical protein